MYHGEVAEHTGNTVKTTFNVTFSLTGIAAPNLIEDFVTAVLEEKGHVYSDVSGTIRWC